MEPQRRRHVRCNNAEQVLANVWAGGGLGQGETSVIMVVDWSVSWLVWELHLSPHADVPAPKAMAFSSDWHVRGWKESATISIHPPNSSPIPNHPSSGTIDKNLHHNHVTNQS